MIPKAIKIIGDDRNSLADAVNSICARVRLIEDGLRSLGNDVLKDEAQELEAQELEDAVIMTQQLVLKQYCFRRAVELPILAILAPVPAVCNSIGLIKEHSDMHDVYNCDYSSFDCNPIGSLHLLPPPGPDPSFVHDNCVSQPPSLGDRDLLLQDPTPAASTVNSQLICASHQMHTTSYDKDLQDSSQDSSESDMRSHECEEHPGSLHPFDVLSVVHEAPNYLAPAGPTV